MSNAGEKTRTSADGNGPSAEAGCIVRIQTLLEDCTPVESRVGKAILADPQAVMLASVSELAERSGTSEAAISRFARRLGYKSYAEFKVALARDSVSPAEAIHEDIALDDEPRAVIDKVTAATIRAIEDTRQVLDENILVEAAQRISGARRVAFFGFGGSAIAAQDAWHHFLRILPDTVYIGDSHEQMMWTALSGPHDVLLLCSHTGASRDLVEVAKTARSAGAYVITITNYGRSPLTAEADLNLFTSTRETRFREESLSSRIAAMTIIDALYVLVALERPEELVERRDKIRMAIHAKRMQAERTDHR